MEILANAAWAIHKSTGTETTWRNFSALRNKVTTLVREDKRQYQLTLMKRMERNPKLLYRVANQRASVKPGIFPIHTADSLTDSA